MASTVFRVTGLTRDQPDVALEAALKGILLDRFSSEERSQIEAEITIVPSCYDYNHQRVALVQFRGGIPQFLSKLIANPLKDSQMEMGDTDLNIDCHFFGFTQLYAPKDNEPVNAE
jgi:hypothetical protein